MKGDINTLLNNLADAAVQFFPMILLALLVLVGGYVVGKVAERLVRRLILYLDSRVNQVLQKNSVEVYFKTSARFISRAFFWVTIASSILVCVHILGLELSTALWFSRLLGYLPNILIAIIIVFAGYFLGQFLGDLIKAAALRTGLANGNYLGRMVKYVTLFVAIVISLDQLRVDIAFLKDVVVIILAGLLFGASLAFGLGARTSVSNILGSYYVRKNHQVGDRIQLDGVGGVIVKITDHAVSVETTAGLAVIPAKKFNEHTVTMTGEDEINQ